MKRIWNFVKLLLIHALALAWVCSVLYCFYKKGFFETLNNNGVLAISGFIFYLLFYIILYRKELKNYVYDYADGLLENTFDNFCKNKEIKGLKKDLLKIFINEDYIKQINEDNDKDNKGVIKEQIEKAKKNKYNNSYLAFCMLIDRCIDIANNKQQPYCFKEIAEAFGLEWKGRRYLAYIAYRVLGNIGGLLEEYNKKEGNEKIPCVNASVVTKWERDKSNKWYCNGGIKSTNWCCYPEYKQGGEDDRDFILELCKIVKEAKEDKITSWKNEYYKLLTEEFETKNKKIKQEENKFKFAEQKALDKVYKNYKENVIKKMSYQELENKQKNNNSKSNGDNDK